MSGPPARIQVTVVQDSYAPGAGPWTTTIDVTDVISVAPARAHGAGSDAPLDDTRLVLRGNSTLWRPLFLEDDADGMPSSPRELLVSEGEHIVRFMISGATQRGATPRASRFFAPGWGGRSKPRPPPRSASAAGTGRTRHRSHRGASTAPPVCPPEQSCAGKAGARTESTASADVAPTRAWPRTGPPPGVASVVHLNAGLSLAQEVDGHGHIPHL
jgi:hypothetical protein